MNQKQTIEEVAKIMGKKDLNCRSVRLAYEGLEDGSTLLGPWKGTAKYMEKVAQSHIAAKYPGFSKVLQVARGRQLGDDLFAIYRK